MEDNLHELTMTSNHNINMNLSANLLPQQPSKKQGLKTLVLDLDETLVHSSFEEIEDPHYHLTVEVDNNTLDVYGHIRPYVKEFLISLQNFYEIIIFTASLNNYADPLMDIIDPGGICTS